MSYIAPSFDCLNLMNIMVSLMMRPCDANTGGNDGM